MKPGVKTTEFWVVVLTSVLSVLVGGGWLTTEQAQVVNDATAQFVQAAAGLVLALTPLVGMGVYVWSRTRVKTKQ